MRISELMSRKVVTIGPAESGLDAVVRMQRARVRHLPVVNRDGRLVGMVTDRDLRHHLFSLRVFAALLRAEVPAAAHSRPPGAPRKQNAGESTWPMCRNHERRASPR